MRAKIRAMLLALAMSGLALGGPALAQSGSAGGTSSGTTTGGATGTTSGGSSMGANSGTGVGTDTGAGTGTGSNLGVDTGAASSGTGTSVGATGGSAVGQDVGGTSTLSSGLGTAGQTAGTINLDENYLLGFSQVDVQNLDIQADDVVDLQSMTDVSQANKLIQALTLDEKASQTAQQLSDQLRQQGILQDNQQIIGFHEGKLIRADQSIVEQAKSDVGAEAGSTQNQPDRM